MVQHRHFDIDNGISIQTLALELKKLDLYIFVKIDWGPAALPEQKYMAKMPHRNIYKVF